MTIQTAGAAAVAAVKSYGAKLKARFDVSKGLKGQVLFVDDSGKPFPVNPGNLVTRIRAATDDTTLDQAKGASQPFSEVFNSWYRFSHDSSGVFPAIPAETQTWSYDAVANKIQNTTNSSSLIGLVGPDNFTDYVFDATVSSTNSDDDNIGLVLAFVIDSQGKEHALTLECTGLIQTAGQPGGKFTLYYNHNQSNGKILRSQYFVATPFAWTDYPKGVRIRAVRSGDVFNIELSEPMVAGDPDTLVHTVVFDLSTDPVLAGLFSAGARVGYCAQSQAASTWEVSVRPEIRHDIIDKRNNDVWRYVSDQWTVIGKVEDVLPRGRIYKDLVSNQAHVLHRDAQFYRIGGPGSI